MYCDGRVSSSCKQRRQWFTHSSWTCTLIPESYAAPSSSPLHIPQPHSVLWFRESALFPPDTNPQCSGLYIPAHAHVVLEAGPRSGHYVCLSLSEQWWFTAQQMSVRPTFWMSAILAFSLLLDKQNNKWRIISCLFLLKSAAPIVKLWHVISGKRMDHLFKGRWINTLIKLPETDFGNSPRLNQSAGRSRADPTKLRYSEYYLRSGHITRFLRCKQGRKNWAGTFNHWHLL